MNHFCVKFRKDLLRNALVTVQTKCVQRKKSAGVHYACYVTAVVYVTSEHMWTGVYHILSMFYLDFL